MIDGSFPDPDVVKINGRWYAYATNTAHLLPTATAPTVDGPWTYVGDAMPGGPDHSWAADGFTWAPDVFPNPDGTITLTYTALNPSIDKECIGVATASSPTGPFVPQGSGPLIWQSDIGGSIDANTFLGDGSVEARHNDVGFATMPYGASAIIPTGFTPALTHFADIDGDERDDLIDLIDDGIVFAWHNDAGFASMPFGTRLLIADGWLDPTRLKLADLDGDGRDEIMSIEEPTGDVRAWHNDEGFVETPYGDSVVIEDDIADPTRVFRL